MFRQTNGPSLNGELVNALTISILPDICLQILYFSQTLFKIVLIAFLLIVREVHPYNRCTIFVRLIPNGLLVSSASILVSKYSPAHSRLSKNLKQFYHLRYTTICLFNIRCLSLSFSMFTYYLSQHINH